MDDSTVLGMAFGSAGETRVLMCEVTSSKSGCCAKNWLICYSMAVAGDLPEGSLWRTTSNIFAFILGFPCYAATCQLRPHATVESLPRGPQCQKM